MTLLTLTLPLTGESWMADNGNGTFTNPLFYDEFSDPDIIRVGDDFYFTGTTMHAMPGLPVLHSKDLVNWELLGYAFDKLDLGPEFRLEDGKEVYGQGIWAPCLRYHNGTFYIFANINQHTTQLFTAINPAGPWQHTKLKRSFHDLSVLFDDDGKVYVVWGFGDLHVARFNEQLDDIVPGSEHVLPLENAGMGEGSHFYKIKGKYYIVSDRFDGPMRMACARADKPEGPYEVNPRISAGEEFGLQESQRLLDAKGTGFQLRPLNPKHSDLAMHQGGIVDTSKGEWWGFSMMDGNSVGRLTCLSPVTWQDGWPYYGLPGNLKRTPRIWVKPDTGHTSVPSKPYQRNDEFNGPRFANVWQWNHVPVDDKWSLTERPGFLRLHSLPAPDFWSARNTLTQRGIGPESIPTAELDTSGLADGDIAGLALLNYPYAWIGVARTADGFELQQFDQRTGQTARTSFPGGRIWLRAHCDFLTEKATFSYSKDGKTFRPFGDEFEMIFQIKTFQGVRYSLFNYSTSGVSGGHADFDRFIVEEPRPSGLTRPIPAGKTITLENMMDSSVLAVKGDTLAAVSKSDQLSSASAAKFKVLGLPLGRVALQSLVDDRLVTVTGLGEASRVSLEKGRDDDDSQAFQWTEMPRGDLLLLSLASHRHLCIQPDNGTVAADAPGAQFDRQNGASFTWREANAAPADAGLHWTNPLIPQRADPYVFLHQDGYYYFTATVPEYDRIELRRARAIAEIATATPTVIWRKHATGAMGAHIWAPEIHFINGKWYVYFAAGEAENQWNIRMYVLENASSNPLEGAWTEKGQIKMNWESFTLDATSFEHQGNRYLAWAQAELEGKGTNIYIAKMDSPWSIAGKQIVISRPELPWEQAGCKVNEGPAVLEKNGRIFLTYSASATDANYCLGMLSADANADLLDPASWKKSPEPVLKTDAAANQFGPGHNSFTTTPDGQTDILVYHARSYEKIQGDPLKNHDRATRAQIICWKPDGTPDFGTPVADCPYKPLISFHAPYGTLTATLDPQELKKTATPSSALDVIKKP